MTDPTSTAGRKAAFKAGNALPPASPGSAPGYPITSGEQWDKARQAVGRVKNAARRASLARLLRKTAPQFGRTQVLGESWAAPGGSSMANQYTRAMLFAEPDSYAGNGVETMHDHSHEHTHSDGVTHDHAHAHGHDTALEMPLNADPSVLRTPANSDLRGSAGQADSQSGSRAFRDYGGSKPGGALSNTGQRSISLARQMPVQRMDDIVISRSSAGTAIVRHRRGGHDIGEIGKTDSGQWTSRIGGRELAPHTQQRAALMELLGMYNRGSLTPQHAASEPLVPPAVQTPLMQQFGIPAIAAQLATPTNGASDGGRTTSAADDGPDDDNDSSADSNGSKAGPGGLTPKGVAIYKRLIAKGLKPNQALAMARRAQNFGQKAS